MHVWGWRAYVAGDIHGGGMHSRDMHGRGSVCIAGGVHGGGHMWQWEGHAWQWRACVAGSEGYVRKGGICGTGHAWHGGGGQERQPLQRTVHSLLQCILVSVKSTRSLPFVKNTLFSFHNWLKQHEYLHDKNLIYFNSKNKKFNIIVPKIPV